MALLEIPFNLFEEPVKISGPIVGLIQAFDPITLLSLEI